MGSAGGLALRPRRAPVTDDSSAPTRTESAPIFKNSAEDLLARLERDGTEPAREMAKEARGLVDLFRAWGNLRPPDNERITAIRALFDLNRRAMDYLSRGAGPGSRR